MGISGLITLILVLFDQITKYLAVINLKDKSPFEIIGNVFELRYLENQSAAFGIDLVTLLQRLFKFSYFDYYPDIFLKFKMLFFTIFTIAVVFLLIFLYYKIPNTGRFFYLNFSFILFIAGAIGNLIDRVINNYVIDFFYFKLINFPIFNVADIYVTVAAFLFIVLSFFYYKEEDFDIIFSKQLSK